MTWTDTTYSNTTNRNTSRFVLLNDVQADSVVSLFVHFRTADEQGRGIPFYMTTGDPVVFSVTSSGV